MSLAIEILPPGSPSGSMLQWKWTVRSHLEVIDTGTEWDYSTAADAAWACYFAERPARGSEGTSPRDIHQIAQDNGVSARGLP